MHIDATQCTPELHELHSSQRLGEDVSDLISYPNMLNLHLALLDALTKKMTLSINILASVMIYRIPA